jgi:hypothetical protein
MWKIHCGLSHDTYEEPRWIAHVDYGLDSEWQSRRGSRPLGCRRLSCGFWFVWGSMLWVLRDVAASNECVSVCEEE